MGLKAKLIDIICPTMLAMDRTGNLLTVTHHMLAIFFFNFFLGHESNQLVDPL
jgi:hypothetical protein